jgi:autotransporter-associated beta strand protein
VDTNGNWNNPANWSSGVIATGVNFTATFNANFTATRFVNLGPSLAIGNLSFTDSNTGSAGGVTITNGTMTLQVNSGAPAIMVSDVTATVNSALAGSQGLTKSGAGTVILGGANSYSGATSLSAGALRATHNNALGSTSGSTSIGNAADARLELAGGVTVGEAITISCKAAANGNVPAVVNVSGTNTLSGTLSLTTGGSFWTFEAAGGKLRVTGAVNNTTTVNARTIWLRGAAAGELVSVIGDSAAALATNIRKDDTGVWTLAGNNIYSGSTTVSNGTLLVTGTVRGSGVEVYEGVLAGTGLVTSPVTMFPGAILAPGNSIGTLTISTNLVLLAGGNAIFEVNSDTLAHDLIMGMNNVTYGGTLTISLIGGGTAITNGASFQLFSAASYGGAFDAIVPATPGPGLAWDTSQLTVNGTLGVTLPVNTTPTSLTFALVGNQLSISWPTDHTGWRLEGQTNDLSIGISNNWFTVPGSSATNQVFLPVDSANGAVFYRLIYP